MVKIDQCIYEQLLRLPSVPPETGGILGSRNNKIDTMILDENMPSYHKGIYVPDVSFLNKCIEKWGKENIVFSGMFHTHALNWTNLSGGDKQYIMLIMNELPASIFKLYFPLVFPSNFIKAFYAKKFENQIFILEDKIEVV